MSDPALIVRIHARRDPGRRRRPTTAPLEHVLATRRLEGLTRDADDHAERPTVTVEQFVPLGLVRVVMSVAACDDRMISRDAAASSLAFLGEHGDGGLVRRRGATSSAPGSVTTTSRSGACACCRRTRGRPPAAPSPRPATPRQRLRSRRADTVRRSGVRVATTARRSSQRTSSRRSATVQQHDRRRPRRCQQQGTLRPRRPGPGARAQVGPSGSRRSRPTAHRSPPRRRRSRFTVDHLAGADAAA